MGQSESGPQEMSPDEQEARSCRYVVGLRLALLSSGNWAVWSGDQGPEIMSTLDEGWLRSCGEAERAARDQFDKDWDTGEVDLGAEDLGRSRTLQAEMTVEDLGL